MATPKYQPDELEAMRVSAFTQGAKLIYIVHRDTPQACVLTIPITDLLDEIERLAG